MTKNRLFLAMVLVPLSIVAIYMFVFATPLYEARSVIAITTSSDAEADASPGLLGRLGETSDLQELFRASTFLNSPALMEALEAEYGLVTELSGPAVDPLRRLRAIPILSIDKHEMFDRFVAASIDNQSGLMTVHVRAPDPKRAVEISNAVLAYVDEKVAELSQELFDTRQSYATEMRLAAEERLHAAQVQMLTLQVANQEVNPRNRIEAIYSRIRELESETRKLQREIKQVEIEGYSGNPQTKKLEALVAYMQDEIRSEREQLVTPEGLSTTPLNNLLVEYEMAQLEVDLAEQAVKTSIAAQADAGREAALNRNYLQVVEPPNSVQVPAYPRIPGTLAFCLIILLTAFAVVSGFVKPGYRA